jgi:hypothetical protein
MGLIQYPEHWYFEDPEQPHSGKKEKKKKKKRKRAFCHVWELLRTDLSESSRPVSSMLRGRVVKEGVELG